MELPGEELGLYLSDPANIGNPSPLLSYVSNVEGKVIPPDKIAADVAAGVWKPVRIYTKHRPSVHGAAHRNGVFDAFVLNREFESWFRSSKKVAVHRIAYYDALATEKQWLSHALLGEVPVGKTTERAPSQQQSRSTLYQV